MFRMFNILASSFLALLLVAAPTAHAAVFRVTKVADTADGACNHDCSLREAVLAANAAPGPDVVLLGSGVVAYTLTRAGDGEDQGATGDLDILDDLAIAGENPMSSAIDGGTLDRVLDVHAGASLEVVGVWIRNGLTDHEPGGGIRVAGELTLTNSIVNASAAPDDFGGGVHGEGESSAIRLVRSSISGNRAASGGGISSEGVIDLINSTVVDNFAVAGSGGGLYASSKSHGTVSNSTFAHNDASEKGGGVFVGSEPFISVTHPVFKNSIIAANGGGIHGDCSGSALSAGNNLVGIGGGCLDFAASTNLLGTAASPLDPGLNDAGLVGGNTVAFVPKATSPAVNHGSGCEAADQRGAVRPEPCDIGSVEVTAQCISGGGKLCLQNGRFQVEVRYDTTTGTDGTGLAIPLTNDSGYFWFFNSANVELTVKVLDGCGVNNKYWVFVSGMTNVAVRMTVTDLVTGVTKTYTNPLNQTFKTVTDTSAFASCG
jgi:CSLREA domain-containing protein